MIIDAIRKPIPDACNDQEMECRYVSISTKKPLYY